MLPLASRSNATLDGLGAPISYEEFYAFGATALLMILASARSVAKRYRFTGKERDDESGYEPGAPSSGLSSIREPSIPYVRSSSSS